MAPNVGRKDLPLSVCLSYAHLIPIPIITSLKKTHLNLIKSLKSNIALRHSRNNSRSMNMNAVRAQIVQTNLICICLEY